MKRRFKKTLAVVLSLSMIMGTQMMAGAGSVVTANSVVKTNYTSETVGNADLSTGYLGDISTGYELQDNQKVTIEFTNKSSGTNNWNNFMILLGATSGNDAYEIVRLDNFAIKQGDAGLVIKPSVTTFDYSNYNWDVFAAEMANAEVVMEVVRSAGKFVVKCEIVTSTGTNRYYEFTTTPAGELKDKEVVALSVDAAYLEINKVAVENIDNNYDSSLVGYYKFDSVN